MNEGGSEVLGELPVGGKLGSPRAKRDEIETSGRYREALSELEDLSRTIDPHAEPFEWADLLAVRGQVYLRLGRLADAIRDCEEAYEILRLTDRHETVGLVMLTLGNALLSTGAIDRARSCLQDSVSTFRRFGDETLAVWCSNQLARAFLIMGEWRVALKHLETGLAYAERGADDRRVRMFCTNIGTVNRMLGDWVKAGHYYDRAAKLLKELQNQYPEDVFLLFKCRILAVTGALRTLQRRWEEARTLLRQALEISRDLGVEREEALVHEYWGDLEFAAGNPELALEFFEKARHILERIAPRGDVVNEVYRRLSEVQLVLGSHAEAETFARQALEISKALGDRAEEATSYRALAMALWRQNRI
ncbi:hypothetical protein AMJ82_11795, partial [candidate division TA06 bacterium SM23_40]